MAGGGAARRGRGRRVGPGQEGLWDFTSGGRDRNPGGRGPGAPYAGGELGALESPLWPRRNAPQGWDGPCERHTNELSPKERLTRSLLSLTEVASHIYNVPVKPISCESVVGPAFYWILVNSELVK